MTYFRASSVALNRVKIGDNSTFQPIGSGVFVQKGNRYGILTAHHCLHQIEPEISLGIGGADSLALVLGTRAEQNVTIAPNLLVEHVLGEPKCPEWGPDLTFIEIIPSNALASLMGRVFFYPLDKDYKAIKRKFGKLGTANVSIGFPQVYYNTNRQPRYVEHLLKHMTFFGTIQKGNVRDKKDWDYFDSSIYYEAQSELPETFGGVSGGPVWGMILRKIDRKPFVEVLDSALIGITFYQTDVKGRQRFLRAHFVKSIFHTSWKDKS